MSDPWNFYDKQYKGSATGHWGSTIDATTSEVFFNRNLRG